VAYSPPSGDSISFNFTESGYTAPAGGDIVFAFGGAVGVTAPPAVFYTQVVVVTDISITALPAQFNYQSLGKGVLEVCVKAPPGRFNYKSLADIAYNIPVASPPAKFYYQGLVGYIDSYKPPVLLTDFVNMTNARRDKAISYDKQHAFDMGPVARTDISEGLMARAWRLRIDGTDVYLAVSDEQNSKWEAEFKEFTLPHSPVYSMDLTFDQNGRPFASWEFNGSVYIYWYDPLLGDMDVKYICAGRTPRARLDARERHQLPDSDIYLFYINDSVDHLEYRIQRDGYEYAYHATIMTQRELTYPLYYGALGELFDVTVTEDAVYKSTKNLYLEVLALARNWRLYIWMSEYLPENEGTHFPAYQLVFKHSAIYPYYVLEDMEVRRDQIAWGEHSEFHSKLVDEDVTLLDDIIGVGVRLAIIPESMPDDEITVLDVDEVLGASIRTVIPNFNLSYMQDEMVLIDTDDVLSASIRTAMISMSMYDGELTVINTDDIISASKVTV